MESVDKFPIVSPRERILDRLCADHDTGRACVALLGRKSDDRVDCIFRSMLLDKLIEAPDDLHHVIERRLFRVLVSNGHLSRARLDLDGLHEERRGRRFDLLRLRERQRDSFPSDAHSAETLFALCACVRKHVLLEETILLPLAKRHVALSEWDAIANAIEAFDCAVARVRGSQGRRAEGRSVRA